MATLAGAIAEFVDVIAAVSGIRFSPDTPTESLPVGPAAFVFTANGQSIGAPADSVTTLHDITVAILSPIGSLPATVDLLLPLYEPIEAALYSHRNGRTSAHYQTFAGVDYTFGPVDWNGIAAIGFLVTVRGVKIQNSI